MFRKMITWLLVLSLGISCLGIAAWADGQKIDTASSRQVAAPGVSVSVETEAVEGLRLQSGETYTAQLEIPTAGQYRLELMYYLPQATTRNILVALEVNGETVNEKAILQSLWQDEGERYSTDTYGNDVYPGSARVYTWQTQALADIKTNETDTFALQQGTNTVTLRVLQGEVLVRRLTAAQDTQLPSFESYKTDLPQGQGTEDYQQVIEGERFSLKSKASIRGLRRRDPNVEPYDPARLTISTLAGSTWATPGDAVTYSFTIEESGIYYISLKYLLDTNGNTPAYKNIYVDGQLLFQGLQDHRFPAAEQYTNYTLSQDGEAIPFYLEAGEHTLKLESSAALFRDVYLEISDIVAQMDALALDIKIIRGNQADTTRDWLIENYIPDIRQQLETMAERLENAYDALETVTGENYTAASSLAIAAEDIRNTLEDRDGLDELVTDIQRFAQGSGSLAEQITTFLNNLLLQPMNIDRIYITAAAAQLPEAGVGFFPSVVEQLKQMFLSFSLDQDLSGTMEKEKLNIWVVRSAAHVEEMRQLAAGFTAQTGIEVNISSVLDEQKILLAVASGDVPDVICGGTLSKPYDLALRGAVQDLTEFADFEAVAAWYDPEMFVPFQYEGGCYALPESANLWITYYRTDILEELNVTVPQTWDEVVDILPVLYANGMNVNTLLANTASLKPMISMLPYLSQNGATLYAQDGASVNFLEKDFSKAFVSLTELYTKYSLPHTVSSFYVNFRDGISPIGMGDMSTYILLKNSSPDLEGRWAIAPAIGVAQADGNVNNENPVVASGCYIMKASDQKAGAWEFLKWWQSAQVQANFAMNLQMTYGEEVLWLPANVAALEIYSPVSEADHAVLLEQMANIREIPLHPAHMLVERALSDAWTNAVINGEAPLTALNTAYINANRDIHKKLKEFGYMNTGGALLRTYAVGTAPEEEKESLE